MGLQWRIHKDTGGVGVMPSTPRDGYSYSILSVKQEQQQPPPAHWLDVPPTSKLLLLFSRLTRKSAKCPTAICWFTPAEMSHCPFHLLQLQIK